MGSASRVTLAALFMLGACASNEADVSVAEPAAKALSFDMAQSCAGITFPVGPESMFMVNRRRGWGDTENADLHPAAQFGEVYSFSTRDSRLGGLSGAEFLDKDTLIAVSDMGALVFLNLEDWGEELVSSVGSVGYLRDETGKIISGKKNADSEGLAFDGETLFVSFERNHRILAYDVLNCDLSALALPVAEFSETGFGVGFSVEDNNGLEAITLVGDHLLIGLEARDPRGLERMALFKPRQAEPIAFTLEARLPEIMQLTGLDYVSGAEGAPGRLYSLYRSYDPIRGNRNAVFVTPFDETGPQGEPQLILKWGKELTIDNYEGIVVRDGGDTSDEIFLIADDNFNSRQKTLIGSLIFDYKAGLAD